MSQFLLRVAICVFAACLVYAQDWKNADMLNGVDFSSLSPAQKATVLKILREHDCSCGCGMKMAQCRMLDPSCSYSRGLASVIVQAIKDGKSEADAVTAASESKFGHVEQPKLLEDPVPIPTGGSPIRGPQTAPVTLV